jgi:TP901-1 family phage major tail protein
MTAQKGRDLLLKVDTTGTGVFATAAGLRSHSVAFNTETVDVSHQESAGQWRELLAGAGLKSAVVKGSGIFRDAASDETVRGYFFDGLILDWQVVIPDFGTVQGPFQVTSLEYGGRHDAELTFDLALESAGQLVFTAM